MSKEIREQIDKIIGFDKSLNENIQNKKKIIDLLFSENEISELYRIKNEIAVNYLNDLEMDPFSNEDDDDLIEFIKNSFDKKGIKVDNVDLKNILNLVNHNILI
jgi:hypothetical protein